MYLERLLLDHGRWSYKRIGRMIAYFFYKNVLFGMCAPRRAHNPHRESVAVAVWYSDVKRL